MKKAILIIHGFLGSLADNECLQDYLTYDKEYDVFARTLPGHYKGENFQKVEYRDWINFIDKELETLINHGYKIIYVIGHSMGGILASYVGSKYYEVKKIVFINSPYIKIKLKQDIVNILENKDYKDYIEVFDKVLHTSIPFFLEFTKLVKEYYDCFSKIDKETLILQSELDRVIPLETPKEIYDNLKSDKKYLTYLEGEKHTIFESSDKNERKEKIALYIKLFLKGGNKWRKIWKEKI